MSKKTGYLLGILLTIIIGMILAWFFCCKSAVGNAVTETPNESTDNLETTTSNRNPTFLGFDLKDPNGSFAFNSTDNFDFNTSEFNIIQPLSDHFPNLGLARANTVKNYLVSKGIASKRLNTLGSLNDNLIPDGTIYHGPIAYRMYDVSPDDDTENKTLEALKARINADPLVLYFGNAQASIALSPVQRQKIADISHYLDKVDGSSAHIVGHTDNTGSRETNIQLGQKRADFIKSYFVSNGIPESKINTTSKGPDEPVATNETEEGRSKNRRSIVSLN